MATPFYITTPIYYVNDRPHIGHVFTTTIADVVARAQRLLGRDVFFLTGVDEHAAKVVDAAAQRGLTAQQWADQNAAVFQDTFARLKMTNNDFVRTSQDRHKTKVQAYVQALLQTGDIYAGQYEGWYDAGQEEYVTENNAKEYGFKSPINGKPLVKKTETNYFFRLEKYRAAVAAAIQSGKLEVLPEARRNEIINRLAEAKDVPISRSGAGGWGIPMPGDPTQTIYVWIDALCNYLTFVDEPDRRHYWTDGGGATHLLAKDILWFHAAVWPAMLLALGQCPGYEWVNLPRRVYSHSFWISEGQKMSKSLGNFIDLEKIDHYVATFSLDALRYFLATQGPLGTTDSDFAEAKFVEVYNTDLANTLGNCFSRVANMTNKYFAGKIPPAAPGSDVLTSESGDLVAKARQAVVDSLGAWAALDLPAAGAAGLGVVRAVDNYIEITAPFKRAKDPVKLQPGGEVATILYHCAEALRVASVLLWPILPEKCGEIWQRLGLDYAAVMAAHASRGEYESWCQWGLLQPGSSIQTGAALFPRYDPAKNG